MLWPILVAEATHRKGLESQLREVALDELEVSGSIPSWLSGTLVRNGPARYEVGDRTLNHWFDGLAMLHAFGFRDGRVSYANRYLRTGAHEAATHRGRIEYSEFATDPCRSVFLARAGHVLAEPRRWRDAQRERQRRAARRALPRADRDAPAGGI